MDALAKKLGRRIFEIRNEHKLTAERLAYENGISKGYLSDLEKGKKLPSLKMLEKISRGLGVELKELFDF